MTKEGVLVGWIVRFLCGLALILSGATGLQERALPSFVSGALILAGTLFFIPRRVLRSVWERMSVLMPWLERGDARCAKLFGDLSTHASSVGGELLFVERVYLVASRGTKAVVQKSGGPAYFDAWFWWARVEPGSVVSVMMNAGWGSHRNVDGILYVSTIYGGLCARDYRRAQRHWRRTNHGAKL
jgi:hypothetical protein